MDQRSIIPDRNIAIRRNLQESLSGLDAHSKSILGLNTNLALPPAHLKNCLPSVVAQLRATKSPRVSLTARDIKYFDDKYSTGLRSYALSKLHPLLTTLRYQSDLSTEHIGLENCCWAAKKCGTLIHHLCLGICPQDPKLILARFASETEPVPSFSNHIALNTLRPAFRFSNLQVIFWLPRSEDSSFSSAHGTPEHTPPYSEESYSLLEEPYEEAAPRILFQEEEFVENAGTAVAFNFLSSSGFFISSRVASFAW